MDDHAWVLARGLPETALHATSRRPINQPSAAPFTCSVAWVGEVVHGDVNHPSINGMQALRLSYLRSSIIPSRVRCARCVPAALTRDCGLVAKLQVRRPK